MRRRDSDNFAGKAVQKIPQASDFLIAQDFAPAVGGAHTWLYEVYRRWPSPVLAITAAAEGDEALRLAQDAFDRGDHGSLVIVREPIRVSEISVTSPSCLMRFWRIYAILKAHAAGASTSLHCLRAFPEGIAGALFKRLRRNSTKLICYAHGEEVLVARTSRQLTILARSVYSAADLVICNSQNTVRLVRDLCASARTTCIHPGVDSGSFAEPITQDAARAFRRTHGWDSNTVVIATIARMEPRKNHITILRAVRALRDEGVPLAYICGSDGEERDRLRECAREMDIENWVWFTGPVTEAQKIRVLKASDIYAMPSVRMGPMIEGFGIVFLEAAAAGIPSICGVTGGQSEAVLDGITGIAADGEDGASVEHALRTLATDERLRHKMKAQCLRWAAQHDWANVANLTYAILKGGPGPVAGVSPLGS